MKIAALMGRGLEGCGVTKFATELKAYLKDDLTVFLNDYKKWGRRDAHVLEYKDMSEYDSKGFDQLWVLSLPAKNFDEENVDKCISLIEKTKCKKVLFQLDHSIQSILRNAKIETFSKIVDVIGVHSAKGDYAKYLRKNFITTPIFQIANPFSFDAHRDRFWKPINTQTKHCSFIGRAAVWKGMEQMYSLHNTILKDMGYISFLEGMELSIGSLRFWFNNGNRKEGIRDDIEFYLQTKGASPAVTPMEKGKCPYIFGNYINIEALERLSKCTFSGHFTTLKPERYGHIAEYTFLENISTGATPIIGESFADNSTGFISNEPQSTNKNCGIIYNETAKENIIKYDTDAKKRDIFRNDCYDYWKSQYDASVVMPKLYELIEKTSKAATITPAEGRGFFKL